METRQHERSKSFRKVMKRTPGGKTVTYAKRRKKKESCKCEICSAPIKISNRKSKALANVCGACTSRLAIIKARVAEGAPTNSVELRYLPYLKKI